ncbi:MAG TPA: FecR domain-containing protein [Prosthecobacter sp.]|nr:FecR domain-containing protein [Prosthecobacter sp.]HRK15648.1 FecR domain-containing protein [Prosthecobacter sp.]
MKPLPLFLMLAVPALLEAAALKEAEVTRIINDVRLVPPRQTPAAARVGDKLRGETALATGAQSRAELRFPDQTLTRLGANSVFRLDARSRDVKLEQGVMLMQVPKQLGGATVRTAAITAAVTGTTIMMEYDPQGHVKIIALEGEVDVYLNERRSELRTLRAGDMLITRPDATSLPAPVQVDLQRLRRTSKLLDAREFSALGNEKQLSEALQDQQKKKEDGELLETAYVLQGRGTSITLSSEARLELLSRLPPEQRRFDFIPGTTQVDGTAQIDTRGIISANNNSLSPGIVTALGAPFNADRDGSFSEFAYGIPPRFTAFDTAYEELGTWSLFKFDELFIAGTPQINSSKGPRNLVFASRGDVNLRTTTLPEFPTANATGVLTLNDALDALAITTVNGDITLDPGFLISGTDQAVFLSAQGGTANVNIEGPPAGVDGASIAVPFGKLYVYAGTDVVIRKAIVQADEVRLQSVRDIRLDQAEVKARSLIEMIAQNGISISNSSSLRALAETGSPSFLLEAQGPQGDIVMNGATLAGEAIRAQTLGTDGRLILGNTSINADQLVKLYAHGSNGSIQFVDDVTLNSPQTILAARRVTVNNGVNVTVGQPAGLDIYTDVPQFNTPGFGDFVSPGQTPITFTPRENLHPFESPQKPAF